ncbi:MAG: carbohydrate kinase family protein [Thermoplasmataceae archaeon]
MGDSVFLGFIGHINIDIVLRTDEIPRSGSTSVREIRENFGGTAGNFALVASRLGYPFRIYSSVSRSTHREYLSLLSRRGVDISGVEVVESGRGPLCYTVSDSRDQVYFVYQGPMASPYLKRVIGNSEHRYLHLGTGLPEDLRWAAENVEYENLVFDPGQEIAYRYSRSDLEYFLEKSQLCMFNENEYSISTRILGAPPEEFCKPLILTRGGKGVVLHDSNGEHHIPPVPAANVYDTIGAGDAFRAGLYLGIHENFDLVKSLKIASHVASVAIQHPLVDFSYDREGIMRIAEGL